MSTSARPWRGRASSRAARTRARRVRGGERLARLPVRHPRAALGGRPREGVGEGRPGPDARGGPGRRLREEEGKVQLVQGRDIRGPREPGRAEVRRRRAQQAVADRHNRVRPARRQGLPVADNGLLRWRAPGVVHRHEPRHEARQRQSEGRVRDPRQGDEGPVIHSDRGYHYRWPGWIGICERNHLVRSMSKKDCLPDNSAMEGFFGRLKNEFFHHRNWSGGGGTRVLPHA